MGYKTIFISYHGKNFFVPTSEMVGLGLEIPQEKLDKKIRDFEKKGDSVRRDLRYTAWVTPAMGALSNLFGFDAWTIPCPDDAVIEILAESGVLDSYKVTKSMSFIDICDVQAKESIQASKIDDLREGKIEGVPLRKYSTIVPRSRLSRLRLLIKDGLR